MIIGIKGRHNSGKTSLIEKIIEKFKHYRIVVVKTSEHETIDVEKSDTNRYRKAGAKAS
ncbi:MAG TPA: molybdopterin-guanine dinucleotide biosynthesis protein B, partial [Thermoplasmata archaeon]|nr:molybdopterin-guanine dinucleotide biosynthesis protein B [Thermoplasmata archaeon]